MSNWTPPQAKHGDTVPVLDLVDPIRVDLVVDSLLQSQQEGAPLRFAAAHAIIELDISDLEYTYNRLINDGADPEEVAATINTRTLTQYDLILKFGRRP